MSRRFRGRLIAALCGVACLTILAPAASQAEPLVIGNIGRDVKRELNDWQPLADYLGSRLHAHGTTGAQVVVVRSVDEMIARLRDGRVDVYIDSPFIAASIARAAGAKPLLRRWKGGVAEYHSVFFTHADSAIRSLDDLRGKVIAFDQPYSSSGYLLPKALLLQRGYRMVEVASADAAVPADAIGYVFTQDDVNTIFWVMRKKVVAGVTYSGLFAKATGVKKEELRVLERSADVPRHTVTYRGDLDPAVVVELERVLLGMDEDEEGRQALAAFERTTRFDRFPDGAEATFAGIRAMLDVLDAPVAN